jgi:catechol 2,3-dioxygenase-like lactoylglutathione lyase family enzyme
MIELHHVQVACPPGGEDDARRFYAEGLGLTEVEKPADLAGRGGAWFRAYDGRGALAAELHVGVEEPFAPARKAHPGLVVDDLGALEARLAAAGVTLARDTSLEGVARGHVADPFGNRLELREAVALP